MVKVIVIAEGQTEEAFINEVVAPALCGLQIYLKPELLSTSKPKNGKPNKGGALSIERFMDNARHMLRANSTGVLTCFIDLYGLDTGFPEFENSKKLGDVYQRVALLEDALHRHVIARVGCRPERFLPHIQPYEYEGLLFSDVSTLASIEPTWGKALGALQKVRGAFDSPEHVNGSYATKPSQRLEDLLHPKYKKTRHGPLAAKRISLATLEQECKHFKGWMDRLRGLAQP